MLLPPVPLLLACLLLLLLLLWGVRHCILLWQVWQRCTTKARGPEGERGGGWRRLEEKEALLGVLMCGLCEQ
jgi:hypothetical protein